MRSGRRNLVRGGVEFFFFLSLSVLYPVRVGSCARRGLSVSWGGVRVRITMDGYYFHASFYQLAGFLLR